ncbi:MAG: sigma 54-interacting transcriptional regulator [Sphingomonadales bacterium]
MVAVNCAALAESMLEAVLFGHERGAFTGAQTAQPGLIRAAHGGSLFLDEVAELPLALQAKLLRVLQEREVLPLGATRPVPVDFRLIAAGNRDLAAEVAAGRFRADLYYRLAVLPLKTLPLAQRRADIPAITAALLLARPGVDGLIAWPDAAALDALMAHDWPGNVRELANVVDRALVLGDGARITIHDLLFDPPALAAPQLPPPLPAVPVPPPPVPAAPMAADPPLPSAPPIRLPALVKAQEQAAIRRVLAECRSRRDAARRLGISERTLRYKLAAFAGLGGGDAMALAAP